LFVDNVQTETLTGTNKRFYENRDGIQEKLNDRSMNMASSTHGTANEEYDSDFDDYSHEDDEQIVHKDSITEQEDQQAQIMV
jgi:hypothetical protein